MKTVGRLLMNQNWQDQMIQRTDGLLHDSSGPQTRRTSKRRHMKNSYASKDFMRTTKKTQEEDKFKKAKWNNKDMKIVENNFDKGQWRSMEPSISEGFVKMLEADKTKAQRLRLKLEVT